METVSSKHVLSLILHNTQDNHQQVRKDVLTFIEDHKALFTPLLIEPNGKRSMDDHLQDMKRPRVWATQMEIQAAVELYGLPIYLYTQTPDRTMYRWLHYTQCMQGATNIRHNHFELAHPGSIHFDCVVDAATLTVSQTPPQLGRS